MILKSCFLSVSKLITILLYFQCLCSVFKVQEKVRTFELFAAYAFGVSHKMVGLSGLEPPTSRLSGVRSNRLSYKPMSLVRLLKAFCEESFDSWWRLPGSNR